MSEVLKYVYWDLDGTLVGEANDIPIVNFYGRDYDPNLYRGRILKALNDRGIDDEGLIKSLNYEGVSATDLYTLAFESTMFMGVRDVLREQVSKERANIMVTYAKQVRVEALFVRYDIGGLFSDIFTLEDLSFTTTGSYDYSANPYNSLFASIGYPEKDLYHVRSSFESEIESAVMVGNYYDVKSGVSDPTVPTIMVDKTGGWVTRNRVQLLLDYLFFGDPVFKLRDLYNSGEFFLEADEIGHFDESWNEVFDGSVMEALMGYDNLRVHLCTLDGERFLIGMPKHHGGIIIEEPWENLTK